MVVKSFRGKLADGGQDRIRLSTIKGKVGYNILKFQVLPYLPATTDQESVCMIWKTKQTSIPTSAPTIDFTDTDLLAAAYYGHRVEDANDASIIIFDNQLFNQDIYITHTEGTGTNVLNYYFELEIISLDDKGAEYTTIRDLRTRGF